MPAVKTRPRQKKSAAELEQIIAEKMKLSPSEIMVLPSGEGWRAKMTRRNSSRSGELWTLADDLRGEFVLEEE